MTTGISLPDAALLERAYFGRTNPVASFPATLYAAAFIGNTEAAGNGYLRVAVANDTTSFPAASPLVNGIVIDFPRAIGSWGGNIDNVRFFDASSAGTERANSALFTGIAVADATVLHIPVGGLTLSIAKT